MNNVLMTVENLSVVYQTSDPVRAVDDVSLNLHEREILGLAGESGCGKSTFAYAINQLLRPPAEITNGKVVFHDTDGDVDVLRLDGPQLSGFRWNKASMVFQGAMNSLNPVTSVRAQMEDVFTTHRPGLRRSERRDRIEELLTTVGVDPTRMSSFPHELSGGMRQRVMIAMALALSPKLMIMDEPTTALDVVVQRGILDEISRLRDEFGFAIVFITHDLPLLLEISDRIAVMQTGRIVELGSAEQIYADAKHPYTQTLLNSFPSLTGERGDFVRIGTTHNKTLEEQG